jgi:hypothetical protein
MFAYATFIIIDAASDLSAMLLVVFTLRKEQGLGIWATYCYPVL